jgi:Replication-relaxation
METTKKKYHEFSRWEVGETHPVKITPRDLEYLHRLFIHGPLSSAMLHQLVWPHATPPMTTGRLKILRRKPNCLVTVPQQLRLSYNANYQNLTFKITKAGVQVLLLKGRISEEVADLYFCLRQNYRTFHHDALAAYITSSIELGCKQLGFAFFGWDYIFTHPKTPLATKQSDNPLRISYLINGTEKHLVPDALFAIETPEGKICFALEADMHNEPIDPHELNRSSYGNKLAGYLAIFRDNLYQRHYGIPNMQVLNVTVSDIHMHNTMKHLKRISTKTRPFLFKALPSMSKYENKPVISGHMLTTEWERVGHDNKLIYK